MALFNFFNRRNGSANHMDRIDAAPQKPAESPQDIFFEKDRKRLSGDDILEVQVEVFAVHVPVIFIKFLIN